jgi:hypothetical protein
MLHVALCQLSMLTVDPESIGLELDSFERQLPELLPRLLPAKDLRELYPAAEGGAPTCCPLQMLGMLLLQFRYDLSEQELYLRCWRDLGFRHALGLEAGEKPSSVRSLRRFRNRLVAARGDDFVLTATLRLAQDEQLIDDVELQAVDSTNTGCRGAVIDTFNLVAAGIGQVIRVVARCLGARPEELARRWELSRYMVRSVKGAASIDWSDECQRNALLTEEIKDADRLARAKTSAAAKRPEVASGPSSSTPMRLNSRRTERSVRPSAGARCCAPGLPSNASFRIWSGWACDTRASSR